MGRKHLRQSGFSLLITLIILVIVTISTLAMMLVMRGGVTASGNIAFRQAAVRVADQGVATAVNWISQSIGANPSSLDADNAANGYFASNGKVPVGSPCPTGFFSPTCYDFYDWTTRNAKNAQRVGTSSLPGGYDIYYVVHRMALTEGACTLPETGCMFPPTASSAGTIAGQSFATGGTYTKNIASTTGFVYYRISVKVVGPRHNNRYVQAFVY